MSNYCIPCCTSCLLILAECRRLVRVSKGLRCIIVSTERDIALSSDVVQDNTGKGYVACFLWFRSQVVKACKAPLKNLRKSFGLRRFTRYSLPKVKLDIQLLSGVLLQWLGMVNIHPLTVSSPGKVVAAVDNTCHFTVSL